MSTISVSLKSSRNPEEVNLIIQRNFELATPLVYIRAEDNRLLFSGDPYVINKVFACQKCHFVSGTRGLDVKEASGPPRASVYRAHFKVEAGAKVLQVYDDLFADSEFSPTAFWKQKDTIIFELPAMEGNNDPIGSIKEFIRSKLLDDASVWKVDDENPYPRALRSTSTTADDGFGPRKQMPPPPTTSSAITAGMAMMPIAESSKGKGKGRKREWSRGRLHKRVAREIPTNLPDAQEALREAYAELDIALDKLELIEAVFKQ